MLDNCILGIDSSGKYCSIICMKGSQIIYDNTMETMDHSRGLAIMLEEAIEKLDPNAKVTKILVTTGPGSFTGLRCGISWALGLSNGFGSEIHGISCFRGFISSYKYSQEKAIVLLDAKRDDFVYCQTFSQEGKELDRPCVLRLSFIVEKLEPNVAIICNENYIYDAIKNSKYKYLVKHIKMSELIQINSVYYSEIFPNYVQQAYVS